MEHVYVYKAQPIVKDEPIQSTTIYIETTIPSADETIGQIDNRFDAEARKLEKALYYSLPGGTYDRLLGHMLKRKASHFIVAHSSPEER